MESRPVVPSDGRPLWVPAHVFDTYSPASFPTTATALLAGSEDTQPIEIWYMRLGHLNQSAIHQLLDNATGMHIGPARPPRCERESERKWKEEMD